MFVGASRSLTSTSLILPSSPLIISVPSHNFSQSELTPQSCTGGPPWRPLLARRNHSGQGGAATEDRPYRTTTFAVTSARNQLIYSVEMTLPSPFIAARNVCHANVAHLTRMGNS